MFVLLFIHQLLFTPALAKTGGCPLDGMWTLSSTGSCYKILNYTDHIKSVIGASESCKSMGGDLASLRTEDDMKVARTLLQNVVSVDGRFLVCFVCEQGRGGGGYGVIWDELKTILDEAELSPIWFSGKEGANNFAYVGGNDVLKEGDFRWLDGSEINNRHWHGGEPNESGGEDCTAMGKVGDSTEKEGLYDVPCCRPWNFMVAHVLCELVFTDSTSSSNDGIFYSKCFPGLFNATTTVQTTESTTTNLRTIGTVITTTQTIKGATTTTKTTKSATPRLQTTENVTIRAQTTKSAATTTQTTESETTNVPTIESTATVVQTAENATTPAQMTESTTTNLQNTETATTTAQTIEDTTTTTETTKTATSRVHTTENVTTHAQTTTSNITNVPTTGGATQTTECTTIDVQTTPSATTNVQVTESAITHAQMTMDVTTTTQTTERATTRLKTTEGTTATVLTTESATATAETTESDSISVQTLSETAVDDVNNMSYSYTDTTAGVTKIVSTGESTTDESAVLMNDTATTAHVTKIVGSSDVTTKLDTRYINKTIAPNSSYIHSTTMTNINTTPAATERNTIVKSTRFSPIYITGRCCLKKRLDISAVLDGLRVVKTNLSSYKRTKVSIDDGRHSARIIGIISMILIFMLVLLLCASDFRQIWRDLKNAILGHPIQM